MIAKGGERESSSVSRLALRLLDNHDPLSGASLPMATAHWTLEGTIPPEVFAAANAGTRLLPTKTAQEQFGALQLYLDVAVFR